MCGIAGMLYADPTRPVSGTVLKAMADSIAHRGPDAEGFWSRPGVGLAHRRLSIIDLAGSDQPLGNEEGTVQVVFNGEIYNYRQLRRDLEDKGHRFRTEGDTEVLVHLYEDHGEQLVHQLRGMFAFAIWDASRRRLLLARDRIGLKPLYIYRDTEKLLFASELKALLAHPRVERCVDPESLEDYVAWGMVPGRRTIFRRMEKLPPGHTLVVRPDRLQGEPQRYWRFPASVDPPAYSLEDWSAAMEAKIDETVGAHRVADVPIGTFLSGGLDSSVIVATLARCSSDPVSTFSMGFHESRFDELPYARQVAERFACRQHTAVVLPDAARSLDELVHFFDEPFADSSAVATMQLARLAREHVKVVLSGDGGDEAFAGYARYAHDLWEAAIRQRIPGWARRQLLAPLAEVWPKADWLPRALRAKTLLTNLSRSPDAAYANTVSRTRLPLRRRLLAADVRSQLNGHRPEGIIQQHFLSARPDNPLQGMIAADVGVLLPDDFLTKVDRASMACGLEVRPPLVDHELLELAAQVPAHWKVRGGRTKWLFKRIYRSRLPADVVDRPKQGFDIPLDDWLRGPLREMFQDCVLSPSGPTAELIDVTAVRRLFRSHLAGSARHGETLWSLLVLARWAERYLMRSGGSHPSLQHPQIGNY